MRCSSCSIRSGSRSSSAAAATTGAERSARSSISGSSAHWKRARRSSSSSSSTTSSAVWTSSVAAGRRLRRSTSGAARTPTARTASSRTAPAGRRRSTNSSCRTTSIVFHGHDHLYARQDLDGIVYQEVPQPGTPGCEAPPQRRRIRLQERHHPRRLGPPSGACLARPGDGRIRPRLLAGRAIRPAQCRGRAHVYYGWPTNASFAIAGVQELHSVVWAVSVVPHASAPRCADRYWPRDLKKIVAQR